MLFSFFTFYFFTFFLTFFDSFFSVGFIKIFNFLEFLFFIFFSTFPIFRIFYFLYFFYFSNFLEFLNFFKFFQEGTAFFPFAEVRKRIDMPLAAHVKEHRAPRIRKNTRTLDSHILVVLARDNARGHRQLFQRHRSKVIDNVNHMILEQIRATAAASAGDISRNRG